MEAAELVIDRTPVTEALSWPQQATAVQIVTPDHYLGASELLKGIKALRNRIVETFGPHCKRAFEAHKALVAEQKAAEEPLTQAERIIKDKMLAYDRQQEAIRAEAQRKAQEQARKDEEARRLVEAAAMEREATATGDAALQAEAEALLAEPIEAPAVLVEKATPQVSGVSYRETYSAAVTDLHKLVQYVAGHPEYANLLLPNGPALNSLARSLKQALKLPGVQVVVKRDIAAGAK